MSRTRNGMTGYASVTRTKAMVAKTVSMPLRRAKRKLQDSDSFEMLTVFFFVLTFVLKALTDGIFVTQGVKGAITDSKYLTMGGVIFFGVCYMARHKVNGIFWRELKQLLGVVLCFIMVTACLIIYRDEFASWQIRDMLNLLTPMLFAYVSLNVMTFEQLYKGMQIALVSSFIGYITQLALRGVTFQDIFQSSFSESQSPLESNDFSAIAIMLCFFFCYYRSNRWMTVLSVVYAIATFKRMAIIFALVAFFLPIIINRDKELPKWSSGVAKLAFFVAAMGYLYFIWPTSTALQHAMNVDVGEMTMGRSGFLASLLNHEYQSFGFGSVESTLGHSLEMAFPRITLELSPLGTLLFINNYWNVTGRHLYCALLMTFQFANLITADSISAMFAWEVCFILIGMIHYANGPEVEAAKQSQLFAKWQR